MIIQALAGLYKTDIFCSYYSISGDELFPQTFYDELIPIRKWRNLPVLILDLFIRDFKTIVGKTPEEYASDIHSDQ